MRRIVWADPNSRAAKGSEALADVTLYELCVELAERGVMAHRATIGRFLKRLGLKSRDQALVAYPVAVVLYNIGGARLVITKGSDACTSDSHVLRENLAHLIVKRYRRQTSRSLDYLCWPRELGQT